VLSRLWTVFSRFWETDRSLSVLLALLILSGLVLPPMLPARGQRGPVSDVVVSLLLLAGIATVWRERRWVFRTVVFFSAVALPVRWVARFSPGGEMPTWRTGTELVVLALLTLVVLAKVLRPGLVTRDRLQGGIAAYLLLGLTWANAYELVALTDPAAFAGAVAAAAEGAPWVYYSLVTLTTMGYGDITPVSPLARSLAVGEALTGQLYLAILISRLVALELQSRNQG
jgi:hypothetical protein